MENIKILVIGKHEWVEKISCSLNDSFLIEKIEDEDAAIKRLTHNSYNILLIQDKFSNIDPVRLASLAYAMTRPSIILCSNIFRYYRFKIWHYFSKFSRKFKISKKLINFNYNLIDLEDQIVYLSNNYLEYFNKVNEEIRKNTLKKMHYEVIQNHI